jgi:hypothetical protein
MKKRSLKVKNKYSTKSDTRVTSSVTSGIAPPETTQPTRTGFNSQTRSGSLGGRYSRSYWAGRKQWDHRRTPSAPRDIKTPRHVPSTEAIAHTYVQENAHHKNKMLSDLPLIAEREREKKNHAM